jgi:eukaryotic-like serine/threonine-protein kinase
MTGRTIGKYRVQGHLGAGAMGTVFKALDETLDREVAIKFLKPGLTDPDSLVRFRREATTLARLNHPAIATIYELFEHEIDLSIVMEFVLGETLEALTRRLGCLAPDQAVFIIDHVLSALAHTHTAGIVHCDIKPANVMVTAGGSVKIMDFGTARVRGSRQGGPSGYLMGTPAYMPPEQLLGQQVDARTDLYAVGVLIYRLLTGTVPFTADTPIDAMRKQITEAPVPASRHRLDLPDWCDRILTRALAKHPSDRFQTAEGFRDALRDASGLPAPEAGRLPAIIVVPATDVADSSDAGTADAPVPASTIAATERVVPGPSLLESAQSNRPRAARSVALFAAAAAILLAVATLRAPSARVGTTAPVGAASVPTGCPVADSRVVSAAAAPTPPATEPVPDEAAPPRAPEIYAFEARIVAGNQKSHQECKCRVVLADGKITWRSEDDRRVDTVAYHRVESMVYSRGRDPLWNGPAGATPVVRTSRGPFAALRLAPERDWLSLRVTDPRLQFVVLRFDDFAEARNALNALEKRIGLRIAALSKRQS